MSYDDFCNCVVEEFESIASKFEEAREAEYREAWERMRLHAAYVMQPHCKNRLNPKKILPLPWDKVVPKKKTRVVSEAEDKKALERLIQKMKKNGQ